MAAMFTLQGAHEVLPQHPASKNADTTPCRLTTQLRLPQSTLSLSQSCGTALLQENQLTWERSLRWGGQTQHRSPAAVMASGDSVGRAANRQRMLLNHLRPVSGLENVLACICEGRRPVLRCVKIVDFDAGHGAVE